MAYEGKLMSKKTNSQHVVKDDDGWVVKKGGSTKATRHFSTQQEAIEWARDIAKRQKAEFYIHGRDGRIRSKDSYSNDPSPPKDKR
jgi:deferrochelatase/peroxidase EfeB